MGTFIQGVAGFTASNFTFLHLGVSFLETAITTRQVSFLVGLDVIGEIRTQFAAEVRAEAWRASFRDFRSYRGFQIFLVSNSVKRRTTASHSE